MKTSNLARDGGVNRNAMRNRRTYLSVPTPASLNGPRRRLGIYILASALLVSIIALAWNGQPAKAKSIPMFIANQYRQSPGTRALEPLDNPPRIPRAALIHGIAGRRGESRGRGRFSRR